MSEKKYVFRDLKALYIDAVRRACPHLREPRNTVELSDKAALNNIQDFAGLERFLNQSYTRIGSGKFYLEGLKAIKVASQSCADDTPIPYCIIGSLGRNYQIDIVMFTEHLLQREGGAV